MKGHPAILFAISCVVMGQTGPITMSSSSARSGDTILLSYGAGSASRKVQMSSKTVTWSIKGPGTLHGANPASIIEYTAPTTIVPNNRMDGCAVLPNDAIFNTRIDQVPANPNSLQILNEVFSTSNAPITFEASWGISHADGSTPVRTLISYYDSVAHPGFPSPSGPDLKRENGNLVGIFSFTAKGNGSPDHHVLSVRKSDCSFFETYDDYTNGYTRPCRDGTPNCSVQSAVTYNSGTYAIQGGTDAAGLLLAPLTWHLDEIKSGVLNHATRFTNNGNFVYNSYIWPAAATAGGNSSCAASSCLQLGSRLRLKSSFSVGSICNSGTNAIDQPCEVMLTALQHYGMFLADTGSNNAIQVSTDVSEDPNVMAALGLITGHITVSPDNFDVLDETSLEVSASSYQVCPYEQKCMGVANSFVQPLDQVIVTATAGGTAVSVPIPLQGTAVGLGIPAQLLVVPGNYSYAIPSWVNGAVNSSVVWSLESGVGTVTSSGVYTPPGNTSGGQSAVLQATTTTNAAATNRVYVNMLPANTASGTVQIDVGASQPTADALGNMWLADPGLDGVDVGRMVPSDYPNWPTTNPQRMIYQSRAGSGNDMRLTAVMPNGNYLVHFLFGFLYNGWPATSTTWIGSAFDAYTFGPNMIETQGVQQRTFDFGLATNYHPATPADVYVPAQVLNGLLQVGLLSYAPDTGASLAPAVGSKINTLNGIEIIPDSSAPHWAIDSQQQTSIMAGASVQLSVVDYYTGSKSAAWAITSGPGAINSAGLLSLPQTFYAANTNVSVRAVSTANSAISATLTLAAVNSTVPIAKTGGQKRPNLLKLAAARTGHLVAVAIRKVGLAIRSVWSVLV